MIRRVAASAGLVALAALAGGAGIVDAKDATTKGDPTVPEPALCADAVEPRSIADLERSAAADAGVGVTIAASPTPDETETGEAEPAGPEATAAATEALETLYACYNANDYPRAFALFTDAGLGRVLPGFGLTAKDLAYLAERPDPVPAPKEAWRAVAVREVLLLPDGRLRATVEGNAPEGPFTAVALLGESDGGYRIDDLTTTSAAPDGKEREGESGG